ncbi:hypothetical protein KKC45_02835 [Patescibacteria group bacterium]|nr:hypothetical protein [Patescibacteria group bacterium]
MNNQNKPFNKYAKLTIWSVIGAILLFTLSFFITDWEFLSNIVFFPLKSWGGWYLMSILFWPLYIGAFVLLALSSIFGIIASIQTHKRNERGGVISLSIAGMAVIFLIILLSNTI